MARLCPVAANLPRRMGDFATIKEAYLAAIAKVWEILGVFAPLYLPADPWHVAFLADEKRAGD
jgi:hypothetical protein